MMAYFHEELHALAEAKGKTMKSYMVETLEFHMRKNNELEEKTLCAPAEEASKEVLVSGNPRTGYNSLKRHEFNFSTQSEHELKQHIKLIPEIVKKLEHTSSQHKTLKISRSQKSFNQGH